jgi:hypothetical protein
LTAIGPYVVATGAGSERAYIGGDGAGNDVQVGSFNASVTNVGFWNAASGTRMNLFAKSYVTVSDARLKTDVQPLTGALDKVLRLRGVTFEWAAAPSGDQTKAGESAVAGKRTRNAGMVAQEILDVVPEAVVQDSRGMYGIAYESVISLLIEAIKEQQERLERLERHISGSGGEHS